MPLVEREPQHQFWGINWEHGVVAEIVVIKLPSVKNLALWNSGIWFVGEPGLAEVDLIVSINYFNL